MKKLIYLVTVDLRESLSALEFLRNMLKPAKILEFC